jgi:anti-anti-sigma factor
VDVVITDTLSRLDQARTRITLEPQGEIDAGSIELLADMVHRALCAGAHELDVDLREVSFMDTEALRILENAREVLSASGGHLCLRNPTPPVRRLLALTAFCPEAIPG